MSMHSPMNCIIWNMFGESDYRKWDAIKLAIYSEIWCLILEKFIG